MEPTKVTRSMRPGTPGTLRLAMRHGAALVCVRYRENEAGSLRYTTVELVVDCRPAGSSLVDVAVAWQEHALRAALKASGARWDPRTRTWRLRRRDARRLKLLARVTTKTNRPSRTQPPLRPFDSR
jgi:hypothetical protein